MTGDPMTHDHPIQPKLSTLLVVLTVLACVPPFTTAAAQTTIGVTYAPLTPNGQAIGTQFDVTVATLTTSTQPVHVAARIDATTPLTLDLYPTTNLGVTLRLPDPNATPYVGTAAGLWWSTIDDVPCWDLIWTVHAGIDVPLWNDVALRVEGQIAPLLDATFQIGVGLALHLP